MIQLSKTSSVLFVRSLRTDKMFEIYLTNAVVLLFVGVIAATYVLYNAIMKGVKRYAQLQVLEALATIAIGAFYLYCSLVWDETTAFPVSHMHFNTFEETIVNTTNNNILGDKFTMSGENQMSYNENYNNANENYLSPNEMQSAETTETHPPQIIDEYKQNNGSIHNQFVLKYQQLLDKIMKLKNKTESKNITKQTGHNNKVSGAFINNIRVPLRQQRDAFANEQSDCLFRTFLKYGMFVSSFVQGVLFLITTSINCKICQNHEIKKRRNGTSHLKESEKAKQTDETKKQDAAQNKTESQTKNKKDTAKKTIDFTVFVAASELRKDRSDSQTKDGNKIVESTKESVSFEENQNYKQITFCIFINFLIPVLCVIVLYYSIMGISAINQNKKSNTLVTNHDFMKIDSNILDLLENPINASNINKINEVGNIISNVYKIIAEQNMTEYSNNIQTQFPPPIIYNILHNLNNDTQVKQSSKLCNYNNLALKIYMFVLVILGYFVTICYMKITQLQLKKNIITQNFKQNIYGFAGFWFPAVIEIFTRMYITENMPNVASDLFTLLGNINHLLINVRNILTSKVLLKSNNLIEPQS